MASNNFYKPALQAKANALRKQMTKAEACLWKYALRAGQTGGYTFRRQRPILDYIVDFICLERKLVIEVDGWTHLNDDVILKDKKRDQDLAAIGFAVIRLEDREVLRNIRAVQELILFKLEEMA